MSFGGRMDTEQEQSSSKYSYSITAIVFRKSGFCNSQWSPYSLPIFFIFFFINNILSRLPNRTLNLLHLLPDLLCEFPSYMSFASKTVLWMKYSIIVNVLHLCSCDNEDDLLFWRPASTLYPFFSEVPSLLCLYHIWRNVLSWKFKVTNQLLQTNAFFMIAFNHHQVFVMVSVLSAFGRVTRRLKWAGDELGCKGQRLLEGYRPQRTCLHRKV